MDTVFGALKEKFPEVQKNVLLKDYGTFCIGGPAEYFLIADTKEKVIGALTLAKQLQLPFVVIGGGSNLLISDKGVKGLVVKMFPSASAIVGFSLEAQKISPNIALNNETIVEAYAGVGLDELVSFTINHSLKGIEWAGGLPGTFGGAIRGNAGAFGGEIKDCVLSVEALDENLTLREFTNSECMFSYRNSLFKEKNWIILAAKLGLTKADKKDLAAIAQSRIHYRVEKHPLDYPNVGSIFKGVAFLDVPDQFKKEFEDKVKNDPFPVVPAAFFVIGAGLTGAQVGQAQISQKHSNYIINLGGAKAQDVLDLIDLVKQKVKAKYNISLEIEVQYVE